MTQTVKEWPAQLQRRQKLDLRRGDVFVHGGVKHAVVGFDGREDGYLCWRCDNQMYNTLAFVTIAKSKAHVAERLFSEEVPELPSVNSVGRPPGSLGPLSRSDGLDKRRGKTPGTPSTAPTSPTGERSVCCSSAPSVASLSLGPSPSFALQSQGQQEERFDGGFVQSQDEPTDTPRQCVLCCWIRRLTWPVLALGEVLKRDVVPREASLEAKVENVASDAEAHPVWNRTHSPSSRTQALPLCADTLSRRLSDWVDLQITIPIVKPPGWQEVERLVHKMPVTFDERGRKETMIVKSSRWAGFVDRQRSKLRREVDHIRKSDCQLTADQDVSELVRMIDCMEDWKDLSRYSGKSINMASTQRGNEMKIHVMAFAERKDADDTSVDFMRLSFSKSVEVPLLRAGNNMVERVLTFLPGLALAKEREERWISLLGRPDVAKFTIALAFQGALASDGVHLQFCEAKLQKGG